ncbi:Hybrid Polyketide synthase-nonribosomal peptide synthetase [Tolypocladium capitatum]|uniref:Hybrid Polyketide synthase-nonribosomal peptide synthetase n=1 Tax=Tolypocladium capitatum TaxID=45235 RepID=A0A2K3QL23_9HYPO|nr:Hybrid Polyketide synthase-nonribosomal peptide synthetase [Tolypocladium capitatum]
MASRVKGPVEDPSVIVGLACRVPGAASPSKLWKSIAEQRDVQQRMPKDRLNMDGFFHPEPAHKGTTNARFGYFLDQDIGHFDAEFFGISGKEAEAMDPQQRLLLEVVYEALENAGIALQEIRGSLTSVFCGSFTNDYNSMLTKDLEYYPKYAATGTGDAILSNRISYFYDLHGTSVTIDTACSSSLVGFHLGSQTLQNGEADISIIVGSSLHYDSNVYVTMTDLGMLSTDGRCAAFDASGSGYVRGEGIACAILKRKSDAVTHGDSIRAIVRATGSNHDGKKNGITLPNSVAQEQLIRSTYEKAGLDPGHTQYFEAHGTGTAAGDPIETHAIGAVFATGRESPLYVGSVKTNIGHLEGASGLAGVIKSTLALERRLIPPNMHFKTPNPNIDFENWKIAVPTSLIEWRVAEGVARRASINSFGYGGTNAHVVLEEHPGHAEVTEAKAPENIANGIHSRPYLVPLTSHSVKAGELSEENLTNYLEGSDNATIADLAYSLSTRRTMHQQRSFVVASDAADLVRQLGTPRPSAPWTLAKNATPRLGFIFTGQGAQWHTMGRQLIEECPHFLQSLQRCDTVLKALPSAPEWSIVAELRKTKETSLLGETLYSQTICTALQLAIVDLIECWGVKPSAIVGHSSGEMAAAYAAGILTFESALIAAYYRGCCMSASRDDGVPGGMMAVGLPEKKCLEELKPFAGRLTIAAVNSPSTMTVSGDEDAILELKEKLTEKEVFVRQLIVKQAFHSHHMFRLAPAYQNALKNRSSFKTQPAKCRMFSSVTSRLADHEKMGAPYWAANMVQAVRFSDALTGILLDERDNQNVDILVEIGPHPALKGPARQTIQALRLELPYVASLTRGVPDFEGLLNMAGNLFSLGYPVDLVTANQNLSRALDGSVVKTVTGTKLGDLPTYTWEHRRYWSETRCIKEHRQRRFRHATLGHRVAGSTAGHPRFRNYLRLSELPWLNDHVVENKVVFPGAGYISMAIEAAIRTDEVENVKMIHVKDIVVKNALLIPSTDEGVEILLELKPATLSAKSHSDTWYEFNVFSYDENADCTSHCHGLVSVEKGDAAPLEYIADYPDGTSFNVLRKKTFRSMPVSTFYKNMAALGLAYGEKFRLLKGSIESGEGFAVSDLVFDPTALPNDAGDETVLHPTLLDSFFHVVFHAVESHMGRPLDEPYVPSFFRVLKISGSFFDWKNDMDVKHFQVGSFTKLPSPRVAISDMILQNEKGELLMEIAGLEATSLGREAPDGQGPRTLFYRQRWQPCFDMMTSVKGRPLPEIVDIFAHQFPNTNILHITSDLHRTRDVLRTLGTDKGERRRFKQLDIWSLQGKEFGEEAEELSKACKGLVNVAEPKADSYDLVIVSEAGGNAVPFMKDCGCILFDGKMGAVSAGLQELFSSTASTALRKVAEPFILPYQLSVVVPAGKPSARASTILKGLRSAFGGKISQTTFAEIAAGTAALSEAVVVLAGLYESASDSTVFKGAQALLISPHKNIIWPTEAATLEAGRPESAMYIGLVRAARSENDTLRAVTFDFGLESPAQSVAVNILRLLDSRIAEDEVTERNGVLYIPRVEADDDRNSKLRNGPNQGPHLEPFGTTETRTPLALRIGKVGLLETLYFGEDTEFMDTEVKDNEVEVETKASSINFRDVAASMGIIEDFNLGDECAGICTKVGANVKGFKPGDRVVALRPGQGAHRSVVRNPASWCYKIPDSMSYVEAAAIPLILSTSWFALGHTARLTKGETVLIHAAAGGVGQMAVQIAQRAGARILATVGSPAKRQLLKDVYGLTEDQMFSSRDASFAKGVMVATNGRGVDVVLNSLAGPLLHASWECMAPFGRFLEIGKRDIHENSKIAMDPFRRNVMFASIDLVTMFEKNEALGEKLFKECFALLANGEIKVPATIKEVSYADVVKGFRLLQMGKHTGKVVLVPRPEDMVPVMRSGYRNTNLFSPCKTYLLVGGMGGLGRTLSQWMVRKGATKLAFLSRSGADKAEAKATVDWLVERGVKAGVYRGDVSKRVDVQSCIDQIGSNLGGVFQAAMVLQDKPLETMTYEQYQRCCQPKVEGTKNLHEVTLGMDLGFFICFSSVSCVVGSKGQANYSAANCYLDALMRHRRELGLSGTTMNVGAVTGIGVVAENEELQKIMLRMGMDTINEEELLYHLEEAVLADKSVAPLTPRGCNGHQIISGVGLISPEVYWAKKPIMKNLYANHDFGADGAGQTSKNLLALLSEEPDVEKKTDILLNGFLKKTASVLATPRESISPSNALSAYGLDSIVAVEFRKWFRKEVHVDIALFEILGAASINALVSKTARMIKTDMASKETVAGKTEKKATSEPESTEEGNTTSAMATGKLTKIQHTDVVPLSTFQSRLWFVHSFLEDKSCLNLLIVLRIKGHPDYHTLQKAIREMAVRNPALRTAYFEGDNFAVQKPLEDFDIGVDYRDLTNEIDKERALEEFVRYNRKIEMSVEEGEVATYSLAKLSEEEWAIVGIMHHISIDRASLIPMMSQFVGIYDAMKTGKDLATVSAPEFNYVDFTLWHNARLASDLMKPDIDWWRSTLEGLPRSSKVLPFAKGERPARSDPRRQKVKTNLDAKLFSRMKRIAAQSSGTPFHFVLAAFRAFLYRYTEEKDLILLIVDGNRPHADTDPLMGFFVNLAPVRCNDDCDVPFDQLFQITKTRALDAMAHSSVPFDTIVDIMNVKKTSAHMPVGQVVVNYQIHGPVPTYQTVDFVIEDIESDDIPTAADIQLEAIETSEHRLDLKIEYSTALYYDADMERFLDNFNTFLTSCIEDHRQPIDEIGMCGPLEIEFLKRNYWNTETKVNQWEGRTVLDVISSIARQHPQATAIKTSDCCSVSYRQLIESAESVASELLGASARPGDCIALIALPGVEAVTGMLGVLMTGSCYVALDADFAHDRLSFMLSDSGARILLVGPGQDALAVDVLSKMVVAPKVIRIEEAAVAGRTIAKPRPRHPDDPFYMIYTSGSTGTPKGVVLKESNTQAMLSTLNKDYGFTHNDNFLAHTTMSFDLSVVQIFGGLTAGATVSVASWETRKDPAALAEFMMKTEISVTYFTPTQFALLMEFNEEALKKCSKYRVAYFAGERLPVRVAKAFYDLGTPATLYNTWSPSELVVQTSISKVSYPDEGVISLPIGYPMDNCRHYLLDTKGNPVPFGQIGELVVGGVQVGAGYLNRPEANARSFSEDPFASENDRKRGWNSMFKTGDRGRFRADGQLEFHGRIAGDKQIKHRGFRIDLGEVEQVIFKESQTLEKAGALMDVAVVAVESDEQQLVAYLVPKADITDESEKVAVVSHLHRKIKPHLNHYMLPNGYQFLSKLPTTLGGKVDRRSLLERQPELVYPSTVATQPGKAAAASANGTLAAPAKDLELSILALFRATLGADIGLNDPFFERGGNSILLVRLQAKVKKQFKITPPLPALIREPTAAAVCAYVRRAHGGNSSKKGGFENVISWNVETNLPNTSQYTPRFGTPRIDRDDLRSVLVTGADSFIGIHLVVEILRAKPDATIHVLGSMEKLEAQTLIDLLEKHDLLTGSLTADQVSSRIKCVPGSLSQAGFGLAKSAFRELGSDVQAVYHLGGHVSLLKTYSALKRLNVAPIFDIIRLSGIGSQLSDIHYLSTWSVVHLQTWSASKRTREDYVVDEEDSTHFTPPTEDESGYFKTRWVAENLLVKAAQRGFPVSITRSSAVTAAAQGTGVLDPCDEFAMRIVVSMIESGMVPQIGRPDQPSFAVDVIPVDWLASSFFALTSRKEALSYSAPSTLYTTPQIYHVTNPRPLRLKDLPQIIADLRPGQRRAKLVPLEDWLGRMETAGGKDAAAQLVRRAVIKQNLSTGSVMFSLDSKRTMDILDALSPGVMGNCPAVDAELLNGLWKRMQWTEVASETAE